MSFLYKVDQQEPGMRLRGQTLTQQVRNPGFHPVLQQLGVVAQVWDPGTQEDLSGHSQLRREVQDSLAD